MNGCNEGLCTQLTDPTSSLITSPVATGPGLLAYSLNLSAEGSNSSTAASLATGSTGISLQSGSGDPTESLVSGGVIMEDGLTFNVAGGGSADIGVTLTLNGSINVPTDGSYTQTILMDLGLAQLQWSADFVNSNGGTPVSVIDPGTENWVSFSTPTNTATSLVFNGVMSVTSGQDLQFLLNQQLGCNVGASCNFGDPLQISFNLPTGVTFTSDSGVFLSGTSSSTAAPEPNTLGLMGVCWVALAAVAWRRRRIAS